MQLKYQYINLRIIESDVKVREESISLIIVIAIATGDCA